MVFSPKLLKSLKELLRIHPNEKWLPILNLMINDGISPNTPDNIWKGFFNVDNSIGDRLSYTLTKSTESPKREMKIGKVASIAAKRLYDQSFNIKPSDLEKFIEAYRANIKIENIKNSFQIWKGEDIRKAYLEYNYVEEQPGSSLHNSCMAYIRCQKYMDIYVDNPEVCSVIVFMKDNKISGRAIVWETNVGKVMDRVYCTLQSQEEEFIAHTKSIGIGHRKDKYHDYAIEMPDGKIYPFEKIIIQLKEWKFKYYPFLDTFYSLYFKTGILRRNIKIDYNVYTLQSQDGLIGTVCEYCDGTSVIDLDDIDIDCEHCKGEGIVYIKSPY